MRSPLSALGRLRRAALPVGAVAIALAAGLLSSHGDTTDAATKFTVYAGGGRAGISVDIFRPSSIIVSEGDSIEFVNPYAEFHNVAYVKGGEPGDDWEELAADYPLIMPVGPAPLPGVAPPPGPPKLAINPQVGNPVGGTKIDGSAYVNSGFLFEDDSWTATFSKQGAYKLLCLIHPFMEVDVQVLPAGSSVPTQAQLDAEAAGALAGLLGKGEAVAAAAKPGKSANANGTTTWDVVSGMFDPPATVNRFAPARLQIGVGDTVNFVNNTPVPHTVTFNASTPPSFVVPEGGSSGPPLLVVDPRVLFPAGGKTFDGSGYANSGFIGTGPEAVAGASYSLTFTKPGTYSYICVLHIDQGMAGVIEVGPAGSGSTGTVRPPNTGDAGLIPASESGSYAIFYYAGGALLVLAGALALRLRGSIA